MKHKHKARVRWIKPEDGGRPSPPLGPQYSTVARFEALAERWPREAWSVVLYIAAPADADGVMLVEIDMLAGHDAPKELLSPGSRFELFEGRKRVATGEVL
jgi:hypothetical protein